MEIYRRFFEVKDQATLQAINDLMSIRVAYLDSLLEIQKRIGAESTAAYNEDSSFAGFNFEKQPNKDDWKKSKELWLPKLKSKKGRALNDEIKSLQKPSSFNEILKSHDLPTDFGNAPMQGMTIYYASLFGSDDKGWMVSVPWKDVDPAEFTKENSQECGNLLKLLKWKPHAEWVEMKEWEVMKIMGGD